MKVLGAGFGRTGTNSLKKALEILGFGPCYHFFEILKYPSHVEFWNSAIDGKPVNWKEFFRSYNSVVDWPSLSFLHDLLLEYPKLKIVLTIREAADWYLSAKSTIFANMANGQYSQSPNVRKTLAMAKRLVLDGEFSGRYQEEAHCIAVYEEHINKVKSLVPPERLLIFHVSQGWEPLCKFLNVAEIPKQEFPHTNTRASFDKIVPR